MKQPHFEIQLATDSHQSRVTLNGEDISAAVRRVEISQTAGEIPVVKLQLSHGAMTKLSVEAKLIIQQSPTESLRAQPELEEQDPAV